MASVGPNLLEERMRVGRLLWSNDISAEYSTADNPKLNKQMNEVSAGVGKFGINRNVSSSTVSLVGFRAYRRAFLLGFCHEARGTEFEKTS